MRFGLPSLQVSVLAAVLVAGCGGKATGVTPGDDGGQSVGDDVDSGIPGQGDGGGGGVEGGGHPSGPPPTVSKIDLLFMIDNSASMGDKQDVLAGAVADMLEKLTVVSDMHVGIVTSSLGGRGGDQCPANATNPAAPQLNAHNDDRGELVNRGGKLGDPTVETAISDLGGSNFLSWFPDVAANQGTAFAADAGDRRPRHARRRLHRDGRRRPRARLRLRGAERGVVPLPRPAGPVRRRS